MLFLESSAKSGDAVKSVFEEVVAKVLESPALLANSVPSTKQGLARLDAPLPAVQSKSACC
jgi:hypothetical protein